MILDFNYNRNTHRFVLSYINETGSKSLLDFNVKLFKSYYYTPTGKFDAWNGAKCDIKYTEEPSKFDIKEYIADLDGKYKTLIENTTYPKLYTFDIETEISDEFPEPSEAKQPITVISIASPDFNVLVLGTRKLSNEDIERCQTQYEQYLQNTAYFNTLNKPLGQFKYQYFKSEEEMLRYFLKNVVAKVPVLSGWNCIQFDWQYITNRIEKYYPNLSIRESSCVRTTTRQAFVNMKGEKYYLPMPAHTLIADMMQCIDYFDHSVLPLKESLTLDYIAEKSLGVNKIKYEGTLQDLFEQDYPKYVYYNIIDSVLVQLINYRFRTMDILYQYSLKCKDKIGSGMSMIALTESLVFNDFHEHGIKVVYEQKDDIVRGNLVGAYVKDPRAGFYNYVVCNDFASLYPSTIMTCNLSFENYIGHGFSEAELDAYRADPNYFVSVNGNVYKNDHDYAFRRIQTDLKATRNVSKYLAKELDATLMSDIDNILHGREMTEYEYDDRIHNNLIENGYTAIHKNTDLKSMTKDKLLLMQRFYKDHITYHTAKEQAMKALGNSMYGGSSHVAFYWFNMDLANDITGEARNLIHMMESHLSTFWHDNWASMTDLHKQLGITVIKEKVEVNTRNSPIIYGDTDSLYITYEPLLRTIEGYEHMTIDEKLRIVLGLNLDFLDGHNNEFISAYYTKRHARSVHKFELETVALSGIWLNVKKRYSQILLYKDGKYYPHDALPLKTKGLEIIKSSTPAAARAVLTKLMRYLLEETDRDYFIHKLNYRLQQLRQEFNNAPLEDICGNLNVNGYTKYIIDDTGAALNAKKGTPFNVRALGNYNQIRNYNHLDGEPIYGGKLKWYQYRNPKNNQLSPFAFRSNQYPEWANRYAPVDKRTMFQVFVLDPINRILNDIGMPSLLLDGSVQIDFFNEKM